MSNKYFTHATPTLFNAGTPRPQLSSCYLIAMESDSISIYNTLGDVLLLVNGLEALVCIFIILEVQVVISAEQMEQVMVLFQCCVYLIIQRAMLAKGGGTQWFFCYLFGTMASRYNGIFRYEEKSWR